MSNIIVNGSRISYTKKGEGHKLFILHDGLLDSSGWKETIDYLSKTYEVIAYDRRGYGESDASTKEYSNLDDLKAIFDEIGIENTYLLAGSMGGGLGIDFTIQYPNLVSGLILIGAVINGYKYSDQMIHRNYKNYKPLIENHDVEGCIKSWSEDEYLMAKSNSDARSKFYSLLCKNYKNITHDPRMIKADNIGAIDRLGEIDKPTLIIVGEDDIHDVHMQAKLLKSNIRNSKMVLLSGCGHLTYLEKPIETNNLIDEFIQNNK